MAGLLDLFNSPEGQQALGLLAAGGPQTDPSKTGFGQRLAAASGFADQWKQRQADAEMEKQKMAINAMLMQKHQMDLDSAKQSFADQTEMRNLPSQFRIPATPNGLPGGLSSDTVNALPKEFQTGSAVQPAPPRPAGFDREGYGAALESRFPEAGLAYQQKIKKDDTPVKLGAGEQLLSGAASGFKLLASGAPKPESKPSALQEYEYSRSQGYNGTFDQWDTARRRAGASTVSVNTGQKGLDNEMKFSAAFKGEPIYKAHQEVQSAHSQITQALKLQSPAGDLAGATKMMKILDPGSVVRESELGMAMAASGALDRLTNYSDRILKGTKLTPTQRTDFQNLANNLYDESVKQYNNKRTEYHGFAGKYGLASDVLLGKPAATAAPAKIDKPKDKAPVPMKGMVQGGYKFKGGNPADQANWEKQ